MVMSEYVPIKTETLTNIGDAVRIKTGETAKMSPDEMATTLKALNITLQEKTVSPSETEQTVTADAEYYGLSGVTVSAVLLQEKTVTPSTEEQIIEPDEGYYGLSSVTVAAREDSGGETVLPPGAFIYYKATASSTLERYFESSASGRIRRNG